MVDTVPVESTLAERKRWLKRRFFTIEPYQWPDEQRDASLLRDSHTIRRIAPCMAAYRKFMAFAGIRWSSLRNCFEFVFIRFNKFRYYAARWTCMLIFCGRGSTNSEFALLATLERLSTTGSATLAYMRCYMSNCSPILWNTSECYTYSPAVSFQTSRVIPRLPGNTVAFTWRMLSSAGLVRHRISVLLTL